MVQAVPNAVIVFGWTPVRTKKSKRHAALPLLWILVIGLLSFTVRAEGHSAAPPAPPADPMSEMTYYRPLTLVPVPQGMAERLSEGLTPLAPVPVDRFLDPRTVDAVLRSA